MAGGVCINRMCRLRRVKSGNAETVPELNFFLAALVYIMALKLSGRALHWVFKIGDRSKTIDFYRNVLGMKVLRHEEFEEGCEATCNG